MKRSTLWVRSLRRNPRSLVLAGLGITLGIATFVFFVALGHGVQQHVLDRVFSVNQLEVVPRSVEVGAFQTRGLFAPSGTGLDDVVVEDLRALEGVQAVYPRLNVRFPALATGGEALLGDSLWTELLGDGIPEGPLDDVDVPTDPTLAFTDWESRTTCTQTSDCAPGATCQSGACVASACAPADEVVAGPDRNALLRFADALAAQSGVRRRHFDVRTLEGARDNRPPHRLVAASGDALTLYETAEQLLETQPWPGVVLLDGGVRNACPQPAYCQAGSRTCQMPVPVLLSPTLLELYNGNVQSMLSGSSSSRKPPRMTADALIGFGFRGELGRGFLGTSAGSQAGQGVESIQLRVVGFSDRAIALGVTMPIGYVARWNARWGTQGEATDYDSLLVVTDDSRSLAAVATRITDDLGLQIDRKYEDARRASLTILVLVGVIGLFSLLVVGLAALNIMNTFLMLMAERRREIGVLRALGATRADVYAMVLVEAAAVSFAAVTLAILLTWLGTLAADAAFTSATPDFPFKPTTLFAWPWWLIPSAYALGAAFGLAGAWVPAQRAARMDPTDALRG